MGMEKPLDLHRPPSARLTGALLRTSSRPGSAGLASARTNTAPDLEQTMACRDVETRRKSRDRERFRKRTADRKARGLCPRCGVRPPANGLSACESCAEKRRLTGRARDAGCVPKENRYGIQTRPGYPNAAATVSRPPNVPRGGFVQSAERNPLKPGADCARLAARRGAPRTAPATRRASRPESSTVGVIRRACSTPIRIPTY